MAARLTYEPAELRDALPYIAQATEALLQTHGGNWRRKFPYFIEEMTKRFEALKLLTSLLDGNTNVDIGAWFKAAAKGAPPPPPERPYEVMALGWQQVQAAVKQGGEGFFRTGTFVDLPYVVTNGFPGESFGERFYRWQVAYIDPFITHLRAWGRRILERVPASGRLDLWDLAIAVVNDTGFVAEEHVGDATQPAPRLADEVAGREATVAPPAKKSATKKAVAKKEASKKGASKKAAAKTKGAKSKRAD